MKHLNFTKTGAVELPKDYLTDKVSNEIRNNAITNILNKKISIDEFNKNPSKNDIKKQKAADHNLITIEKLKNANNGKFINVISDVDINFLFDKYQKFSQSDLMVEIIKNNYGYFITADDGSLLKFPLKVKGSKLKKTKKYNILKEWENKLEIFRSFKV